MQNSSSDSSTQKGPRYETRDASPAGILLFMAAVLLSCVAGFFAVRVMMGHLEKRAGQTDRSLAAHPEISSSAKPTVYFPYPREQPNASEDLAILRARENTELNSYGWIDRKSGVVRIPIARAMDLISQRGLPTRGESNATGAGPGVLQLQQERPNTQEEPK